MNTAQLALVSSIEQTASNDSIRIPYNDGAQLQGPDGKFQRLMKENDAVSASLKSDEIGNFYIELEFTR